MKSLRAKLIKAAQDHPEKRADLLPLIRLAGPIEHAEKKLTQTLQAVVGRRGKVTYVDWSPGQLAKWTVVFDTEHAALYAYWKYKDAKGARFGKAGGGGFYLSVE